MDQNNRKANKPSTHTTATKTHRNIYTMSQQVKTPQLETGQHLHHLENGAEHHRTKQGPP